MSYAIRSITPRGNAPIELGKLTVLVGANNSGKSQTLKDLHDYVVHGVTDSLVLLEQVDDELPPLEQIKAGLRILPENPGRSTFKFVSSDLLNRYEFGAETEWIDSTYARLHLNQGHKRALLSHLGRVFVAHLGAEARFQLAAETPNFNPRTESPANALQAFWFSHAEKQGPFRAAFKSTFGTDIGLDWAAMTHLYLRISPDFGVIPEEQPTLDALMKDARPLSTQGDGYKSFAGVALALLTFQDRLLLLDEPEAFLHPAQARTLGSWLAGQARDREGQVIVATHSADFLAGVVSAYPEASIIRLNRSDDQTKYHVVPLAATRDLVTSPLLSSQPVLDSLFHRGVVVCEGDPDRAIYQTVAHRLLGDARAENLLFIHSNGKDTIKTPATLLRQSSTPVACIADFDVLSSPRTLGDIYTAVAGEPLSVEMLELRNEVARFVEVGTPVPVGEEGDDSVEVLRQQVRAWSEQQYPSLRDARRALGGIANRAGGVWDRAKKEGIGMLDVETRPKAEQLIQALGQRGVFVVPVGELESFLAIGVAKGSEWNRRALERLYGDEGAPQPLQEFVQAVTGFLLD